MKAITAAVSVTTAVLLWPIIPKALRIPSPQQLVVRNRELEMAGRLARLGWWSVNFPGQRVNWSQEVCHIHEVPPGHKPALAEALSFYPPGARERFSRAYSNRIAF
jgi:hypothetical protein